MVRNRLVLCTSPYQVLSAKSALDKNSHDKKDKDTLAIIHPELSDRAIELITTLSKELGFENTFNFVPEMKSLMRLFWGDLRLKRIPFLFLGAGKRRKEKLLDGIEEIRRRLQSHYDEVYLRMGGVTIEPFFLNNVLAERVDQTELFGFDDGIGNYSRGEQEPSFFIKSYLNLKKAYSVFALSSNSLDFSLNRFPLTRFIKTKKDFAVLRHSTAVSTESEFRSNLKRVSHLSTKRPNQCVVILGTGFDQIERFNISTEQEIELYNQTVARVCKRYEITPQQVFYKPHPRINPKSYEKKRKGLHCQIDEYNENSVFELEFPHQNIKAVLSVGSTSLLTAHELYGIPAFLIDTTHLPLRKNQLRMIRSVSKSFGISSFTDATS